MQVLRTDFKGRGKWKTVADTFNKIGRVINNLSGDPGIEVYAVGEDIRLRTTGVGGAGGGGPRLLPQWWTEVYAEVDEGSEDIASKIRVRGGWRKVVGQGAPEYVSNAAGYALQSVAAAEGWVVVSFGYARTQDPYDNGTWGAVEFKDTEALEDFEDDTRRRVFYIAKITAKDDSFHVENVTNHILEVYDVRTGIDVGPPPEDAPPEPENDPT